MKKNGAYICQLDRFGYSLIVVGQTPDIALSAMQQEYIRTYARANCLNRKELYDALFRPILNEDGEVDKCDPRNLFVLDFRDAFEECEPKFYEYGKVEWECKRKGDE